MFEKILDKLQGRVALADGGALIPKRGLVDGPGGYAGKEIVLTKDPQYIGTQGSGQRVMQIQDPRSPNYGKWKFKTSKGGSKYFSSLEKLEAFREKSAKEGRARTGKINIERAIKNKPVYNSINQWTEKWITKNAPNYSADQNEKFINDLKKAWKKESTKKIYNGVIKTKDGFPNVGVTSAKTATPFSMYGLKPIHQIRPDRKTQYGFFSKIFYANKLKTDKTLSQAFKDHLNYFNTNKRGVVNKSTTLQQIKNTFGNYDDRRVIRMLTSESGMDNLSRNDLYTSFFGDDYKRYAEKSDVTGTAYKKNMKVIKQKYGIDIRSQLEKEQKFLKKTLRVKELPPLMRYSADHLFGVAQAAKSNNKTFAVQAVNNLVGMTATQNKLLGMGIFEQDRKNLVKKINQAPVSQKQGLVNQLNTLMKNTYKNYMPNQKEFYALDKNKLVISPNFKPLSQQDRVLGFAKQIVKENSLSNLKQTFKDKEVYNALAELKKGKTGQILNLMKNKQGGSATLGGLLTAGIVSGGLLLSTDSEAATTASLPDTASTSGVGSTAVPAAAVGASFVPKVRKTISKAGKYIPGPVKTAGGFLLKRVLPPALVASVAYDLADKAQYETPGEYAATIAQQPLDFVGLGFLAEKAKENMRMRRYATKEELAQLDNQGMMDYYNETSSQNGIDSLKQMLLARANRMEFGQAGEFNPYQIDAYQDTGDEPVYRIPEATKRFLKREQGLGSLEDIYGP